MTDLPSFRLTRRADLPAMPEITAILTEQTASCTLPTGEEVTVSHRVPLYTLARELDKRGYGDWRLQAYTPTGTPGLRGLVGVMAGLTVEETDRDGLRLRRYRSFPAQPVSRGISSRAVEVQERVPGRGGTTTLKVIDGGLCQPSTAAA